MRICAPFAGIIHYRVKPGDKVDTGMVLASVEAVKLEAPIPSPGPGVVKELLCENYADVAGGDVLIVLEES
ncbi:acetyl-CoA carboxylase biotin carboxyl carrier protein subunit [Corynebacterium spheniscorum]|uniref:Biotin-requiring enzyme n=1 Tax=Corynebacterium spheniscorum TaxID=185761 RepID=A0A1I2SAT4_9CORY|nr:acetyl-CoA carboxylase biotin carboxyl carrier protein subunit [Corynebacterium spheniscorum]KAA8723936.1 acetyl-CoA carboxylase biotin carboxyl carrier protein subunit [Corynebacterium spheniscorum]SFG49928.1 Biotin-requiring enzyme [Corynebacterium spheniscorum]